MNRPVALVCYICGRQFGTKSLAIHIKSCQKKWENQQNLKPPRQRRPCPQPPKGLQQLLSKDSITKKDIQTMNTGAFQTYVEEALVQCEYCGRKFNPTSLKPHQKACKTSPMIKKPSKGPPPSTYKQQPQVPISVPKKSYNLEGASQGPVNLQLEECGKCGRKFASDRIMKHEKVCKGEGIKKVEEPPPPPPKKPTNMKPQKDPKWKIQSQQLQNAMKAMRQLKMIQAKGGKISDLPPPPRSNYDHYIQCQYCGRKYAKEVAERHIPKCKDIINKPGGIKPSTIQQKYISGTGAQKPVNISSNTKPIQPPPNSQLRASQDKRPGQQTTQSKFQQPTPSKVQNPVYQTSNQQYGKLFKK